MIGPLTYLDIALIVLAFISGLLAMYRGLARELLSILSWLAAAGVGYWIFAYKKALASDVAAQTGLPPQIAIAAVALGVALIVLILVHLITARISDAILDSQVGMVDRILGFGFGVLRGFLLFVIPYMAYEAFISPDPQNQHPIVRDSFFRGSLKSTGDSIRMVLLQYLPQPSSAPPQGEQQGSLQHDGRLVTLAVDRRQYYMTRV